MNLKDATSEVRANGPRRVVIDGVGEALSPSRAAELFGIVPTVVFLRADGWTLGAAKDLRDTAQAMWPESWVAVMEDYPNGEFVALSG